MLSPQIRGQDYIFKTININNVKFKISHVSKRVYIEIKTHEGKDTSIKFLLESGAAISLIKRADAER